MRFTTLFGLRSQATRLQSATNANRSAIRTGLAPSLDCSPAQGDFGWAKRLESYTFTLQLLLADG